MLEACGVRAAPASVPAVVRIKAPCARLSRTHSSGSVPFFLRQQPARTTRRLSRGAGPSFRAPAFHTCFCFGESLGQGRVAPSKVQTGGAAHAPGPHRPRGVAGSRAAPARDGRGGEPGVGLWAPLSGPAPPQVPLSSGDAEGTRAKVVAGLRVSGPGGPRALSPGLSPRRWWPRLRSPGHSCIAHHWMPPGPILGHRNSPAGPGTGAPRGR